MLYAILCYDSEAVTSSWSKEKDDQVMADVQTDDADKWWARATAVVTMPIGLQFWGDRDSLGLLWSIGSTPK